MNISMKNKIRTYCCNNKKHTINEGEKSHRNRRKIVHPSIDQSELVFVVDPLFCRVGEPKTFLLLQHLLVAKYKERKFSYISQEL